MDEEKSIESNNGESFENSIIVETGDSQKGVAYEYQELRKKYPMYRITLQYVTEKNNKIYDVFEIDLPNEEKTEVYFNISNFYGK
jgi:hypothetical protein